MSTPLRMYRTNNVRARNGVQIGTGWQDIYLAADVARVLTKYQALFHACQLALGALADIHLSRDMTLAIAQKKAARLYTEVSAEVAKLEGTERGTPVTKEDA